MSRGEGFGVEELGEEIDREGQVEFGRAVRRGKAKRTGLSREKALLASVTEERAIG